MPETIGKYTIASQLGRGGMGVVYKAYDESLRRFVAIKVLSENLTDDETFLQRFVREAQAAAGVTHPNIVQIYFIGEHEEKPYFVMEYVTGKSLAGLLREESRIPNPRSAQMILQAAHGLAAAHDQGIIHRDIKPGNLMLDERGIVKIADFGLALPVAAGKRLTATGMLVGTPGYLAPEQCRGETVDHRTDIYALGVTYYELLSGTSPFQGESPFALMRKILEEEPPDIAVLFPDVDAETLRIVSKMLAKDRDQRYQNCHELATDLEELLAKSGVRSATAGLATRVPTAAQRASAASAADVATQVTAPMLVSQSEAASIEGGAVPPAPTERIAVPAAQNVEPKTQPEVSFVEPPTVVQAPAPAAPQRSRLPLVLIVIAVLVGASLIAAYAAMTLYRGWQARRQVVAAVSQPEPLAASSATTTSTSAALLLSAPNAAVGSQITGNAPATAAPKGAAAVVQPGAAPAVAAPTGRAPTVVPVPTAVPGAQIATPRESAPPATVRPALAAPSARPALPLSGVAVVVTGDAALTGPVASVLTEELGAAGLAGVVDAASHPSLEDVSRDSSTARLLARVRDEGIATVVVARIQATGQRELSYMRRQDTAYNARLTLTSYDTATGRMIGAPASAQIEYTARTAEREAESVVGPLARACARIIQGREQP